jgi:hypothetical protein
MNGKLADVAKEEEKGLLMLAELALHAAIMGEMRKLYNERYLHKGDYREMTETGRNSMGDEVHGSSKVVL